jgi:type II secretory pathway pseudopilin PulG
MRHPRAARRTGGFTLLETALTLVIIAVGVLAVVDAQQYFMQGNRWSSHAASGTFLANEIRELTRSLPRHDPVGGLTLIDGNLVGWGREPGEVQVGDFDDIDDFDGMSFRFDGTPATPGEGGPILDDDELPGPIDAFGQVIAGLDAMIPGDGGKVPATTFGWVQAVFVDKVDPFDYAQVLPPSFEIPPAGNFAGVPVDRFPLRVTVIVSYQGPFDSEPGEVTRVSWIVP